MRLDYKTEHIQIVSVCGIICEFSDIRIDQSTVPEGKYQYEAAGDDGNGGDPARVRVIIMANLFGTLISDQSKMMVYYGREMAILYGCKNL